MGKAFYWNAGNDDDAQQGALTALAFTHRLPPPVCGTTKENMPVSKP